MEKKVFRNTSARQKKAHWSHCSPCGRCHLRTRMKYPRVPQMLAMQVTQRKSGLARKLGKNPRRTRRRRFSATGYNRCPVCEAM